MHYHYTLAWPANSTIKSIYVQAPCILQFTHDQMWQCGRDICLLITPTISSSDCIPLQLLGQTQSPCAENDIPFSIKRFFSSYLIHQNIGMKKQGIYICFILLQDEKNQILTTNVWLNLVRFNIMCLVSLLLNGCYTVLKNLKSIRIQRSLHGVYQGKLFN